MKFILSLLAIFAFCISCKTSTPSKPSVQLPAEQPDSISFEINTFSYYAKNTYQATHIPTYFIFNSYASFDSIYMGYPLFPMDTSQILNQDKMQSKFLIDILVRAAYSINLTIQAITLSHGILSVYYTSSEPSYHPSFDSNNHVLAVVTSCQYDSVRFYENSILVENPYIEIHQ